MQLVETVSGIGSGRYLTALARGAARAGIAKKLLKDEEAPEGWDVVTEQVYHCSSWHTRWAFPPLVEVELLSSFPGVSGQHLAGERGVCDNYHPANTTNFITWPDGSQDCVHWLNKARNFRVIR